MRLSSERCCSARSAVILAAAALQIAQLGAVFRAQIRLRLGAAQEHDHAETGDCGPGEKSMLHRSTVFIIAPVGGRMAFFRRIIRGAALSDRHRYHLRLAREYDPKQGRSSKKMSGGMQFACGAGDGRLVIAVQVICRGRLHGVTCAGPPGPPLDHIRSGICRRAWRGRISATLP